MRHKVAGRSQRVVKLDCECITDRKQQKTLQTRTFRSLSMKKQAQKRKSEFEEALKRDKRKGGAHRYLNKNTYNQYLRRKTPENTFVQKSQTRNGKRVIGLERKRGREKVPESLVKELEGKVWSRIKGKVKAPDKRRESTTPILMEILRLASILTE